MLKIITQLELNSRGMMLHKLQPQLIELFFLLLSSGLQFLPLDFQLLRLHLNRTYLTQLLTICILPLITKTRLFSFKLSLLRFMLEYQLLSLDINLIIQMFYSFISVSDLIQQFQQSALRGRQLLQFSFEIKRL